MKISSEKAKDNNNLHNANGTTIFHCQGWYDFRFSLFHFD
jgi:hypothetical protein